MGLIVNVMMDTTLSIMKSVSPVLIIIIGMGGNAEALVEIVLMASYGIIKKGHAIFLT